MANSNHVGLFDINKFIVILGGIEINGFAKDSFVKVEQNEDTMTDDEGIDGEIAVVATNRHKCTVTLQILQSSLSNDILSGFQIAKQLIPLLIKDLKGTTVFGAEYAWIKKPSVLDYGSEPKIREWAVNAAPYIFINGGNDA